MSFLPPKTGLHVENRAIEANKLEMLNFLVEFTSE